MCLDGPVKHVESAETLKLKTFIFYWLPVFIIISD